MSLFYFIAYFFIGVAGSLGCVGWVIGGLLETAPVFLFFFGGCAFIVPLGWVCPILPGRVRIGCLFWGITLILDPDRKALLHQHLPDAMLQPNSSQSNVASMSSQSAFPWHVHKPPGIQDQALSPPEPPVAVRPVVGKVANKAANIAVINKYFVLMVCLLIECFDLRRIDVTIACELPDSSAW